MKRLLVIGAGFLQKFVIKKAKDMGYYVIAIDGSSKAEGLIFADKAYVVDIKNEIDCFKIAKQENIDGVLTAATDFGVLTTSYIANKLNLPGIPYKTACIIKNKYEVRKLLSENLVDDMSACFLVDADSNYGKINEKIEFPVMVKPCDGSGSRGASRVENANQLEASCKYAISSSVIGKAEVEPFIVGDEYGVECQVKEDKIIMMVVMKKWMTNPPYYAELGHAYPADLPESILEKIRECVSKAISVLGVKNSSINMDLLVTKEGKVYIVDIGARMGGNLIGSHIVPMGTGYDYMGNMIRIAVGDTIDDTVSESQNVVTRLLAYNQGMIKSLPDEKFYEMEYGAKIYHHMVEGEMVNQYKSNLDGLGYIVVCSDNMEKAIENVELVKDNINKECIERI